MKRWIATLCTAAMLVGLCGCGEPAVPGVAVYDAAGEVMGTPTAPASSTDLLTDAAYSSYIDVVLIEAITALAAATGTTTEEAQISLFRDGYSIHTAFDTAVFTALKTGYRERAPQNLEFASAVTDYNGRLLATYSVGEQTHVLTPQAPHSSFKPLGVYAPALDAGVIDWSTQITDKPYSQTTDADGSTVDWPKNATGTYSYQKTNLYECIRQSLNTTAVHCLYRLGVDKSISFLEKSFGINLEYEKTTMEQKGADEIIGNIALGSMKEGVTAVDMAGYYQIFGNAGRYVTPHAVLEIRDAAGQTVYTHSAEPKQIIKESTAYIMNQLLRGVVKGGGTGDQAQTSTVPVAGKTGTGNRNEGNWFVGVTPEYSMSVFHGPVDGGNIADRLYGSILSHLPEHTVTDFPSCATVRKAVFCMDSGKLFSSSCTRMYVGYYDRENEPLTCKAH